MENSPLVGPANILIVDDRPDNILVMKAVLEGSPEYGITTASSGAEAIELVKQKDFALILLDIQMPVMDGYETAAEIKKLERGKNIPIVMVTAIFREDPHILKGYAAGAIDYIGKPFNPHILKAKVDVYTKVYLKSRQDAYLREVERLLREEGDANIILENMPIGVTIVDRSGALQRLNQEARRIWGGASPKMHSGSWPDSGRPLRSEEWAINRAIEKGETTLCEIIRIHCEDGTEKIVLNSATPLRNQGQITGGVDLMQDITAQRRLQTEFVPTK